MDRGLSGPSSLLAIKSALTLEAALEVANRWCVFRKMVKDKRFSYRLKKKMKGILDSEKKSKGLYIHS
jgi:hypothetical protein